MGARGPVPRPKETLRGHRSKADKAVSRAPAAAAAKEFTIPAEDRAWHPLAKKVWRAVRKSAQVRFYQPSDWAVLYSLMDDLTYYKNAPKRSSQMHASIMSTLTCLLLTEGDRRRVGIELDSTTGEELESAGVTELAKWREKLGAS